MHSAAEMGMETVVQALLDSGANPNIRAKDKTTPVIRAAIRGHHLCVAALMRSRAELDAKDLWMKRNAFLWATCKEHRRVIEVLGRDAQRANVNATDKYSNDAMKMALTFVPKQHPTGGLSLRGWRGVTLLLRAGVRQDARLRAAIRPDRLPSGSGSWMMRVVCETWLEAVRACGAKIVAHDRVVSVFQRRLVAKVFSTLCRDPIQALSLATNIHQNTIASIYGMVIF